MTSSTFLGAGTTLRRALALTAVCALAGGASFAAHGRSTAPPPHPVQVLGMHLERALPDAPPTDPAPAAPADVAIAPLPDQLTGPVHLAPPPAALHNGRFAGVVPSGGTWAVVIGINDYPGSSHDLRAAVADADTTEQALAAAGVPGDHRLVLRDGQATAATMLTAADWLVAHSSSEATAVFFYAGHARHISDATQALVGADGAVVTDATLADHLRPLKARRTWITIAACYGGGFTEVLAPGRVLTAAAPADQVSYETTAFNHSYLVEYMVQQGMLDGRGGATVQSAFAYAKAAIARDYPDRQPVELESAAADLVLAPAGATPVAGPPAGTSSPGSPPSSSSGAKSGAASSSNGSDGGGQPTTTTTAPPAHHDSCSAATVGVVRCGG